MKLIRFAPNRVGRVYAGGAEIDRLQGVEAPADGGCPEEWIASTVEAQGPRRPGEGVSRVLLPDGATRRLNCSSGILNVQKESVSLLSSDIHWLEDGQS